VAESPNVWNWVQCLLPAAVLMAAATSNAWGQSLRISPATVSRGGEVSIEISLESPAGKEPLGLQWEMAVPKAEITLLDKVAPGAAATAAGKLVRCAPKKGSQTAAMAVSACILIGGQKPIQNGAIAVMPLRASANAHLGAAKIRLEKPLAVGANSKGVPLAASEAVLTIGK